MFARRPPSGGPSFAGFGAMQGPPPRDVLWLLGILFATFSLQFFQSMAWLPEVLRLTPAVWRLGFIWQLFTYPFVGYGTPSLWFLLELLILFWFARDVYGRLGKKRFRLLLAWGAGSAGLVAVLVQLGGAAIPGAVSPAPFQLMQGQRMLLVIVIAAFATLFGHATIYLFFVLPIQARWFLWLEILFAFMGFLGTRDLAGFAGICAAVGVTYNLLTSGGLRRALRELRLRLEQRRIQLKLARMRRRRGLHVVKDDDDPKQGPWVH